MGVASPTRGKTYRGGSYVGAAGVPRAVPGAVPQAAPPSVPQAAPRAGTVFRAAGSPESTGSLTGHILAHGRMDAPTPQTQQSTRKVMIVGASMLGGMIVVGVIAGLLAGSQIAELINSILYG
ncbi:hypothetical protein GCM10010201_01730 [Pilimelia columellifera subsp. columellifera]|uniref:Uncharacterized protein n=2 Tax=Pilimelia TaxID=53370 RepID=A0ABN3MYB9_9ACTN